MPSSCTKRRMDWVPGSAAWEALAIAEGLFPGLGRQAVVDRLVITGLSAYLSTPWQPPALPGSSRHRWRLPADLGGKVVPGNQGYMPLSRPHFPGSPQPQADASHAVEKENAA